MAYTAFPQSKSLTTPVIYGGTLFLSSSGATGGTIGGGPISIGSLGTTNGLTIFGMPYLDGTGVAWGDGTSNAVNLYLYTTNPTINLTPIDGSNNITIRNALTNADMTLLTLGVGTLWLESQGGGVHIKAQSFGAGYNIVLDGNVVPGNTFPWGYANLGSASTPFQWLYAAHISGDTTGSLRPSISTANGSASVIGSDLAGQLSVTVGGSPTGDLCTVSFAEPYNFNPYVNLTPANAAASQIMATGMPFPSSSTTTFRLVNVTSPVNGTTYIWNYHVVDGHN